MNILVIAIGNLVVPADEQIDVISTAKTNAADQDKIRSMIIIVPVVIGIFQILFCGLANRLYYEFGWKIYKKIGADPHLRSIAFVLDYFN